MEEARADLTFGSHVGLDETRAQVAAALSLDFACHDSSYRGGGYYRAPYLSAHVIVQRNADGDEQAETTWPGPTVVYVEAAEDAAAVERALKGLTLLRSSRW